MAVEGFGFPPARGMAEYKALLRSATLGDGDTYTEPLLTTILFAIGMTPDGRYHINLGWTGNTITAYITDHTVAGTVAAAGPITVQLLIVGEPK